MAIVRRFALSLVRANKSKRSVKTGRKSQVGTRTAAAQMSINLDSVPCITGSSRRQRMNLIHFKNDLQLFDGSTKGENLISKTPHL